MCQPWVYNKTLLGQKGKNYEKCIYCLLSISTIAFNGCSVKGDSVEETDDNSIEEVAIADTVEYEGFTDDGVPIRNQSLDKESYGHHYYDPRDGKWKLFAFDTDTNKMSKDEIAKMDTIIKHEDYDDNN